MDIECGIHSHAVGVIRTGIRTHGHDRTQSRGHACIVCSMRTVVDCRLLASRERKEFGRLCDTSTRRCCPASAPHVPQQSRVSLIYKYTTADYTSCSPTICVCVCTHNATLCIDVYVCCATIRLCKRQHALQ